MQEITEIAELKEIQLGILRKVDELCKAHHLKYFMSDGTLLGAVRHKGCCRFSIYKTDPADTKL